MYTLKPALTLPKKKKILLVTSTSLSTNPRLIKELGLAQKNGHDVTIASFALGNWSDALDADIKKSFPGVSFVEIPANRRPYLLWLLSSLLERAYRFLPYQFLTLGMLSIAVSKRSFLLQKALNKIKDKFDWVIAHNPPAFYPALAFAKKRTSKLGIDIEDYHPGETKDYLAAAVMSKYMNLVLPHAAYCSYASELIMEEVKKNMPALHEDQFVVLNSFSKKEFTAPLPCNSAKARFVWYSQYIREGRGVEKFCKVLQQFPEDCELHLYGSMDEEFFDQYLRPLQHVFHHGVVSQEQLHRELVGYDIGLAIEDGSENLNRRLCVTNKILSYMQAGLFVLATDTPAQKKLLSDNKGVGIITTLIETDLEQAINYLCANITRIRTEKETRYKEAEALAWDEESKKLGFIFK